MKSGSVHPSARSRPRPCKAAFSATALKVAASTEGILRQGFNEENSMKVALVLHQELDISAVAITDREKLLAFTGTGDDHHLPGRPISSAYTLRAIETGEVVYADGNEVPYRCSLHPQCKLGSTLVIPLRGTDGVETSLEAAQTLIRGAVRHLNSGGELRIVANAFLPYPKILDETFGFHEVLAQTGRFKIYRAIMTRQAKK
jgi:LytS/YehU family sensor histidine kinase